MPIIITVKTQEPADEGGYKDVETVYEQTLDDLDIPALVRFINQEKRDGASYAAG